MTDAWLVMLVNENEPGGGDSWGDRGRPARYAGVDALYLGFALCDEHRKIPARQRTSTVAISIWGGLWTRFEYIDATAINMNGTSIALYRRRLCAFFCMAKPHAPALSATTIYSRASFVEDRTFARYLAFPDSNARMVARAAVYP